jgi:hypothetical protein
VFRNVLLFGAWNFISCYLISVKSQFDMFLGLFNLSFRLYSATELACRLCMFVGCFLDMIEYSVVSRIVAFRCEGN